jgi:hypothetical protein
MATLRSKRIRDLLIEIAIAIALVVALIVFKVEHPNADLRWNVIALVVNTAIVFGYLVTWFRDAWLKPLFWSWMMVLFLAHLVVYAVVIIRIHEFPLIYYVIVNTGELALFTSFLRRRIS